MIVRVRARVYAGLFTCRTCECARVCSSTMRVGAAAATIGVPYGGGRTVSLTRRIRRTAPTGYERRARNCRSTGRCSDAPSAPEPERNAATVITSRAFRDRPRPLIVREFLEGWDWSWACHGWADRKCRRREPALADGPYFPNGRQRDDPLTESGAAIKRSPGRRGAEQRPSRSCTPHPATPWPLNVLPLTGGEGWGTKSSFGTTDTALCFRYAPMTPYRLHIRPSQETLCACACKRTERERERELVCERAFAC